MIYVSEKQTKEAVDYVALFAAYVWPPKEPNLARGVDYELDRIGVESVRLLLAAAISSGAGPDDPITFGQFSSPRHEVEAWLKWKYDSQAWWIRAGAIGALIAAACSLLALVKLLGRF